MANGALKSPWVFRLEQGWTFLVAVLQMAFVGVVLGGILAIFANDTSPLIVVLSVGAAIGVVRGITKAGNVSRSRTMRSGDRGD